jgi:hypothetical protein
MAERAPVRLTAERIEALKAKLRATRPDLSEYNISEIVRLASEIPALARHIELSGVQQVPSVTPPRKAKP